MREAYGTTTTMKMAFAFTILFAAFLTIAINYNRAFKVKNETLSILEKYEGVSQKSIAIINNYLKNSGYKTKGKCATDEYGVASLDSEVYEVANNNTNYYYCLSYVCSLNNCVIDNNSKIYYRFKLFFKFNLPLIGELLTYHIDGETKAIKLYSNSQKFM